MQLALKVRKVLPAFRVPQEPLAFRAFRVLQAPPEPLARRAYKGQPVPPEPPVRRVYRELLEHRVYKVLPAFKAPQVLPV